MDMQTRSDDKICSEEIQELIGSHLFSLILMEFYNNLGYSIS
jgi:hypothetical protein